MHISQKLYERADKEDLGSLNVKQRRSYLWIWYWLLSHEPMDFLHNELNRIKTISKDEKLRNQEIMQLAWKAEALEYIIDNR